jgi:hypothetical protein
MAQIVKSETGHWVGKEIYPGEQYFSHGEHRYRHPAIKMITVDFDELQADIYKHLQICIYPQTPQTLVKKIATDLCHESIGVIYLLDYKSPFGVRKIIDFNPDQYTQ